MAWTTWRNPTIANSAYWANATNVFASDTSYSTIGGQNLGTNGTINLWVGSSSIATRPFWVNGTDQYYAGPGVAGNSYLTDAVHNDNLEVFVASPSGDNLHAYGYTTSDIPANAVINGVQVQIQAYGAAGTMYVNNIQVRVDWDFAPFAAPLLPTAEATYAGHIYIAPIPLDAPLLASAEEIYVGTTRMGASVDALIATAEVIYAAASTQSDPPPPPALDWSALGKEDEKVYQAKVYKSDGTFVGVWTDVKDNLQFTQRLETPGTTTTVRLARSPNTKREVRDTLTNQAGEAIVLQDNDGIIVSYLTSNSVGEGTDIDLNYYVDIYVTYGGFEGLITQDGIELVTQDGEHLVVEYGAPNGVRVFSGRVLDYESLYGEQVGVSVTLISHGMTLSQDIVRSGETTTVSYAGTTLDAQVKSILDTNPSNVSYSAQSIDATGITDASKFILNSKLEAIKSIAGRLPTTWYWYGNVADNYIYMKQQASTPQHTFMIGYHIKQLALRRSMEPICNVLYFVGGDVAGTTVFKKYTNATSVTTWGRRVKTITDRRYTDATSMQRRAEREMGDSGAVYTTTVSISSAKYDLESISLGQVVQFANVDNFIDHLSFRITGLTYTPTLLTLELGTLLPSAAQITAGIEERVDNESLAKIPDVPA